MPLGKEDSIVADSTVSSSPQYNMDAPLQVKRATRTYGRRREEPQVETDPWISSAQQPHSSRDSVHHTAPPGLRDEVPPSSPRTHPADSDVGGRDEDDGSISFGEPKFNFAWKDKLKQLDESDDEDNDMATLVKFDGALNETSFGHALLLQSTMDGSSTPIAADNRKIFSPVASLDEDVFGTDSFAGRTETPRGVASFNFSSPSSPLPTVVRSRARNKRVIQGSDSEPEHPKDSSSTTASGSSKHKSRSSSTQPTSASEDEMPAHIIPKSRSEGKRRASVAPRTSVPPLQFTEAPTSELKKFSGAGKKKKIKAPTRKEQQEMFKERSRIMVQTAVSIPRQEPVSKYSIDTLFAKLSGKNAKTAVPTSDPIIPFSSPDKEKPGNLEQNDVRAVSPRRQTPSIRRSLSPDNHDSDEDSDLPEIGQLLTTTIREDTKRKELLELKKRVLQQKTSIVDDDDDGEDDDLEIVQSNAKVAVKEEEEHRRAVHKRPSEGRKRQMQLAQINPSKQVTKLEHAFSPVRKGHGDGPLSMLQQVDVKALNPKKLNQILAAEAQRKAQFEMQKKATEWQKYGGRTAGNAEIRGKGLTAVMQMVAERGLKAAESRAAGKMDLDEDEDEDQSDEEWNPAERGSASPEPIREDENAESDEEEGNDENMSLYEDAGMANNSDVPDEEGTKVRQSRRMVVTSDSEGEENDENAPMRPNQQASQERYQRATSSCDLPTEEEDDKENNTKLMYDRSEDKENTAVVRHGPLTLAPRSLFAGDDMPSPPVSPSHRTGTWGARNREREDDDEDTPNQRRPLKELISEESPRLTQMLPTNLTQSFTAKLQQASPLPSTLAPAPVLKPLFSNDDFSSNTFSGFSQFSQGDANVFGSAPLLKPGFSDLFESTTQKQGESIDLLSGNENPRKFKRVDTLALTQDFSAVNNLQPAFHGSDNLLRKADAIFEKEQAFILEDATRKLPNKPELYVNDHGFLTQTRPADGTPEIYRPSPAQDGLYSSRRGHLFSSAQSGSRTPLRTLSMTSLPDSPTQISPLRRLQRLARTPPPRDEEEQPNSRNAIKSSRRAINAFDILAKGAQKLKRSDELKGRPDLAAYLEDEAAESDDEDAFGFAKPKMVEDDENGEDLDATLEELMDDKEMDDATVAPELVHAKFMEQLEVEDQENEKFHQGVIQGEQRVKRRRGVEVDDSDEDSGMEEENERARRAMKKMRKSDRHDIKTLESNDLTRAFAESYNMTLKDDDTEFSYLEVEGSGIPSEKMPMDEDDENEDDDDENNVPKTVTRDEISRRIRQIQEEGIEDTDMDPQDVSWVDREDEDEEAPRVKTVNSRVRPRGLLQVSLEQSELDGMGAAFRKPANTTTSSSKQWYAQEHKSRNAGTSRSVGGSAITGHTKAKSKTGNGTVRAGSMSKRSDTASTLASGSSARSKPVRPAPSVLSAISDKRGQFA